MQIDPTQNPARVANSELREVKKTEAKQPTTSAPEASTRFQASKLDNTSQDIDMTRVNEIRQAISEGQLELDTSRIADGIIASARALASNE